MLNVLGENYYIDLEELDKYVQIGTVNLESGETKINVIKYEVVKSMIDVILDPNDSDGDPALGARNSNLSTPFKLAFNTLLNIKIIKSY